MKILEKEKIHHKRQLEGTRNERRILGEMGKGQAFIAQLRFAFQTQTRLYLVQDYYAGGNLFYHMQKVHHFTLPRAQLYAAEMLEGLTFLHSRHITYRDLKPENVLIDKHGHLALADFGLCKGGTPEFDGWVTDNTCNTFCGTPEYIAPEVLSGGQSRRAMEDHHADGGGTSAPRHRDPYGPPVDIWALGILIYEMLIGETPFYHPSRSMLFFNIIQTEPRFLDMMTGRSACNITGRDLISGMLAKDPRLRLGCSSADHADLKSHSFFQGIDWQALSRKEILPHWIPEPQKLYIKRKHLEEPIPKESLTAPPTPPGAVTERVGAEGTGDRGPFPPVNVPTSASADKFMSGGAVVEDPDFPDFTFIRGIDKDAF